MASALFEIRAWLKSDDARFETGSVPKSSVSHHIGLISRARPQPMVDVNGCDVEPSGTGEHQQRQRVRAPGHSTRHDGARRREAASGYESCCGQVLGKSRPVLAS